MLGRVGSRGDAKKHEETMLILQVMHFAAGKVMVYKSATCGCCNAWIRRMEANGFKVKGQNVMNLDAVKRRHGVTGNIAACRTAIVDGYVTEGHVSASDVKRLSKERPRVKGIAVPGMPHGSPGMESPYPQPYQTLMFDECGRVKAYARH